MDAVWSEAEAEDLVGPGELADLIGGTTKALGMLRKRNPDFPEPRATAGRTPLFRLGDFVTWYEHSYARGVPIEATGDWRLRRALEACRLDQGLDETRRFAVGVVALCHQYPGLASELAAGEDVAVAITRAVTATHDTDPTLAGALADLTAQVDMAAEPAARLAHQLAAEVETRGEAFALADEALRHLTAMATPAGTTTSESALVGVLVAVADPDTRSTILDPTVGEGSLLLAAGQAANGSAHLYGQERDPWAWRIASARASLHPAGGGVDLGPVPADSLTDDQWRNLRADLCVCDPPFHGKGIDRWLLHAQRHLTPGGRAVVCLPAKTLNPGRREWRVVTPGSVEAIILCPEGLRADTTDAVAIWSVTDHTNDRVLLIDASALTPTADGHHLDSLRDTVRRWRETGTIPADPAPGLQVAAVPTTAIADRDGDLRPGTWLEGHDPAAGDDETDRALSLAMELHTLVEGPLRKVTTEEHRRGLKRLIKRLEHRPTG